MADFNPISGARLILPFAVDAKSPEQIRDRAPAADVRSRDQVELSATGTVLAELHDDQEMRIEKVARVRSELQNGIYTVEGKLEAVLDRVLDDLA